MRLERSFLLSLYLTQGLACASMSYAVSPYLPELAYLTWGMIVLLVVAYCLEGRWTLSTFGANVAAIVIAAGTGLWIVQRIGQPSSERMDLAIMSAPLLPYLGALLMVLMVVKLFRPKRIADYWWLYAIAFMSVALACVLDSEALFGVLLCGYAASGVWSLSLFYLYRNQSRHGGAADLPLPWRGLGVWPGARQALLVIGCGIVLFIVTPRITGTAVPGQATRMQTGLADSDIDLNRTGVVQLNTEVAFTIDARDRSGQPKLDLDSNTLFRSMTLNHYSRGSWGYRPNPPAKGSRQGSIRATGLADLGPRQYSLLYTYTYRPRHRLVLAEPIVLPPEADLLPVVSLTEDNEQLYWRRLASGSLLSPPLPRGVCRYVQVSRPVTDRDWPPVHLDDQQIDQLCRLRNLSGLEEWTAGILKAAVQRDELPASDLKRLPDGSYSSSSHERLARVLEAHLAAGGDFTYSLDLPRFDDRIDPVLDFLWNVKRGHCQRFASGLAAMLRSQGIPAQIVLGFRGVEHQGDGTYLVRHSQAHAWVEALVTRRGPDGKWARYWLTLDPTPATEFSATADAGWYHGFASNAESFWRNFVLDYHADKQSAALQLWDYQVLLRGGGWSLLGILAAALLVRGWRRRQAMPTSSDPLYGQLLAVLARRCGMRPAPTQTPREFADLADRRLHTAGLPAGLPAEIVALHYRHRYGGEAIAEAERAQAQRRIEELDRALSGVHQVVTGG